ncbi:MULTISPECIES: DUF5675 family protein [unclassified Pseudodesulfovibrio]|uniref:DUF5675 family protein n=1 Tax=unclassified Pseudodesulfovibrio TaxID=2661612 RepID=UPI000FEC1FC5|nr:MULTISPECIES: DUF5675 family protein [unclassified Pseudodesulfovibrio]MCJ2166017.1 DUF5675 family protein [Pseudodesulfovibrio sp. S3-i]RWU02545.1 hypothetical protein DWB63_15700 [Pseudodesulfovibrio sp. S3]
MEKVDIVRLEKSPEGTFGVLRLGGQIFCVTLEPPDKGNVPDTSCIPAGRYACKRVNSPTFGPTYEITGVPGRSHILFHQGNVSRDTRGCILLGRHFGVLGQERGVVQSRSVFAEFMDRCRGEQAFQFEIVEPCLEDSCRKYA